MKKFKTYIYILLLFVGQITLAQSTKHYYYEKDYQTNWCKANGGITEYVLPDKARVDCVTKDYAIEFDFASKWAESIGQALYYANILNKKAGIVLISENGAEDFKYINRIKTIAKQSGITLWIMRPKDM